MSSTSDSLVKPVVQPPAKIPVLTPGGATSADLPTDIEDTEDSETGIRCVRACVHAQLHVCMGV